MIPDAGLLLAAALVAFYLQDSAHLLYVDEVVVVGGRRGWRFALGSLELGGRYLHLPNPFLPARPAFRAKWLATDQDAAEHSADLTPFLAAVAPLGRCCIALWCLLLVVLPVAILAWRVPILLLTLLGAVYALIAAMLVLLALRRDRLGMSGRAVAALGAGILFCPPHAINLLRKVCLSRGLHGDPLALAAATLTPDARARLRKQIEGRLELLANAGDDDAWPESIVNARLGQVREMLP